MGRKKEEDPLHSLLFTSFTSRTCSSHTDSFFQPVCEDRSQTVQFTASTARVHAQKSLILACPREKMGVRMTCICQYIFCNTIDKAFSPGHGKQLPVWRVVFLVGAAASFQRLPHHLLTCRVTSLLRHCL